MDGVYAVHGITFKIGKVGRASAALDMVPIKDLESFKPAVESNMENWSPMDMLGWARAAMTGKKVSLSMTGKRNVGDPGNDYIAGLAWKTGEDCASKLEVMVEGDTLKCDVIVDVKTPFGGDSTNISLLEFDLIFDGKPTYTPGV